MEQKLARQEFEKDYENLKDRIERAQLDVISIHKSMNKRDSTIVQDITQSIDEIVHSVISLEE